MQYNTLGHTGWKVSKICLGTMTWGMQNTEDEGHEQMDFALDQGINFFDTAEMYSVPAREHTQGSTERIIGTWFKKTGNRDKIILATKVTGPSPTFSYIADNLGFSKPRIMDAIDKSLARLQTDYVDLYQLHWPERKSNMFGQLGYTHDPNDPWVDNFEEAITTLDELIKLGKIRSWGLSNETPWGLMRCLQVCDKLNMPRPVSVQNPYNLLNRSYEVGLAEMSIREDIGLLAYSPLGFGRLSGKFLKGLDTPQDRINQFSNYTRYNSAPSLEATTQYVGIAEAHNMSPTHLSLAFVSQQAFVTSTIIGATNMAQLKENISSIHITLSDDVIKEINQIHSIISNPAP
jgi:aryl-alcohol dehydrogenase-like predicted oxidoreductase